MSSSSEARPRYVVPRYSAPEDAIWYHVLHGNVPGYQIDFMYCPEVPHGAFTQNHFGHLARLMKYIEPRARAPYAFALGNLSRDDVQHEPGHGGIALIFGLRVEGVLDHAGRAMPPYAHGIVAIDRALDASALRDAALRLHQHLLLEERESHEDMSGRLYRRYARAVRQHPGTVERLLRRYIDGFEALPQPGPSHLGWSFLADESALPERITIVHPDDEPFARIADVTARLGAMLYRSNIRWTTISSGREFDIPGGVSVRFVSASEATSDPVGLVVPIDDVPEDEATMAQTLFGARPRASIAPPARVGWRERDAAKKAAEAAVPEKLASAEGALRPSVPLAAASLDPEAIHLDRGAREEASRRRLWIGLGAAGAGVCALAAILGTTAEPQPVAPIGAVASSAATAHPALATSTQSSHDAGASPPSRALDTTRKAPQDPWRPTRIPKDEVAPPPEPTASPRVPRAAVPQAIGGKPRF
jgi:hypothetical protein